MGIESFFTLQNLTSNQGQAGANASGSASDTLGESVNVEAPNVSFLEFILTRLSENEASTANEETQPQALDSDIAALEAEVATHEAELEINLGDIDPDADPVLAEIDRALDAAEVQRDADNILRPISDGIITVDEINRGGEQLRIEQELLAKEAALEELKVTINALRKDIETSIENGGEAIVISNLTPAQLTQLQNIAEEINAEEGFDISSQDPEALEALLADISAAFISFNNTQEINLDDFSDDPVLQNAIAILQQVQSRTPGAAQQGLANALNGVDGETTGQSNNSQLPLPSQAQDQSGQLAGRLNNLITAGNDITFSAPDGYEGNIADFESALGNARASADTTAGTGQSASSGAPAPDLSFLQNLPFANGVTPLAAPILNGLSDPYATNLSSGTALSIGALSNTITQAASATSAHPATQQVAVNIQRAAGAGGNQDFTVRLDPPGLGRLRVDLSFGKDGLKSTITAERPETYLLFQRDAGALDRMLQDMGLDTDGGVNFELAGQGFDFDGDNSRGGGHDNGGTGAGGESEETEIIESTVIWQIDPQTGLTRYDFLA